MAGEDKEDAPAASAADADAATAESSTAVCGLCMQPIPPAEIEQLKKKHFPITYCMQDRWPHVFLVFPPSYMLNVESCCGRGIKAVNFRMIWMTCS